MASAQSNNTSNQNGTDARPPVVTNATTPVAVAVSQPSGQSNSNKAGSTVQDGNTSQNQVSIQSGSAKPTGQLNEDVTNQLEQRLTELKQELSQLGAADPKRSKVEDAISRIETQLNNQ